MRDVIYLVSIATFFAIATAFVRGCTAIVGHDGAGVAPGVEPAPDDASRAGGETGMTP